MIGIEILLGWKEIYNPKHAKEYLTNKKPWKRMEISIF
jgi:hypothetical protein